jgi:hypothetical protein
MTRPIIVTDKDLLRVIKDGVRLGFVFKSHSHKDNNTVWAVHKKTDKGSHWNYECDCGQFVFQDFKTCPHIKFVGELLRKNRTKKTTD